MAEAPPIDPADQPPYVSPEDAADRLDRAMRLLAEGDFDGALAILVDLEPAVQFNPDPALRVQWARLLNGYGFIDLMDAKEIRRGADTPDDETQHQIERGLKKALAMFERSLAIQAEPVLRRYAAANKAYCLALLGQTDEARMLLAELFKEGGRAAYEGQIRDTRLMTVPEDREITGLIEDVWQEASG